jgi:hypothetical protein
VQRLRWGWRGCIAAALGGWASSAAAEEVSVRDSRPVYRSEVTAGASAGGSNWSVYGGALYAFSGDVRADGWRLRSSAGYGQYRYDGPRSDGVNTHDQEFKGAHAFADLMLGYQKGLGPLTIKAYAGITQDQHEISPTDLENIIQGQRYGLKLALETWVNLGDSAFLQSDLSWSQPFETYSARLRAGYRPSSGWSIGPEISFDGNSVYDSVKGGGFLRFEWERGELSASAGVSTDRSGAADAYGTINLLLRF